MEAVLLMGIQASGKSSFYRARFFNSHVRISLDMLKTRHRERLLLEACLAMRQSFVVDNTNPTRSDRARYLLPAKASGFRTIGYFLESRLADALARNQARPEGERVPPKGIGGTARRLELPSPQEGFDTLFFVRIRQGGGFSVEPWRDEPAEN